MFSLLCLYTTCMEKPEVKLQTIIRYHVGVRIELGSPEEQSVLLIADNSPTPGILFLNLPFKKADMRLHSNVLLKSLNPLMVKYIRSLLYQLPSNSILISII